MQATCGLVLAFVGATKQANEVLEWYHAGKLPFMHNNSQAMCQTEMTVSPK